MSQVPKALQEGAPGIKEVGYIVFPLLGDLRGEHEENENVHGEKEGIV